MFNLDQAIGEWRQKMTAAGIKTPVPLEELESHLRDDFDTQVRGGSTPERAFEIAASRLGLPAAIQREFCKVGSAMPTWARKMNYSVCAVVSVLYCAAGFALLFNIKIPHSQGALDARDLVIGERISLAGAFFSMGLLLSAWMILWRFFPVLSRPQTRLVAAFLCIALGVFCTNIFLSLGADTMAEVAIVIAWAMIPCCAAAASIFGLEEAAYRNAHGRAA